MTCIPIADGIVCVSDSPDYRIRVGGREYVFEWHRIFGPARLTKSGDVHACQPCGFLRAASLWSVQGRQVDSDGLCVWREPTQPVTDDRWAVIEDGEEGWNW